MSTTPSSRGSKILVWVFVLVVAVCMAVALYWARPERSTEFRPYPQDPTPTIGTPDSTTK